MATFGTFCTVYDLVLMSNLHSDADVQLHTLTTVSQEEDVKI